jgi:hypothetical protein
MANAPIPLVYIITFNWFEPILATLGALQAYFAPQDLIELATPNVKYDPSLHALFTQLAGSWLLLAFNDAVTLRITRDVKIWRCILAAGLISDASYTLSLYESLGAARLFVPWVWTGMDWLTIGTTVVPMVIKGAFVAGVGLDFRGGKPKET